MTTKTVTTLNSGDDMPQMRSVFSGIASGDYKHFLEAVSLEAASLLGHFHTVTSEEYPGAFSGHWRHESNFLDTMPIHPYLTTISGERLYSSVPWFYGGSYEALTDFAVDNVEAIPLLIGQWMERTRRMRQAYALRRQAYALRIAELRGYAEDDDIQVNPASESDFWAFVGLGLFGSRASLVLLDNGNLRAVWKDDGGNHVGIQFLGNRMAQYVIFKRRPGTQEISRVAGRDTLEGVRCQLRAFDLASLVDA